MGVRKKAISGSHICKIADEKTAYNKGCLFTKLLINTDILKLLLFISINELFEAGQPPWHGSHVILKSWRFHSEFSIFISDNEQTDPIVNRSRMFSFVKLQKI
jgi:hypothetical protein